MINGRQEKKTRQRAEKYDQVPDPRVVDLSITLVFIPFVIYMVPLLHHDPRRSIHLKSERPQLTLNQRHVGNPGSGLNGVAYVLSLGLPRYGRLRIEGKGIRGPSLFSPCHAATSNRVARTR